MAILLMRLYSFPYTALQHVWFCFQINDRTK